MPFWPAIVDTIQSSLFLQLAAILIIAGVFGFIALKLRQPLIVAFIGIGILVSPSGIGLVPEDAAGPIDALAQLGIALLLFMVGLKLDLKLIRTLGPVALVSGLSQVALTVAFGAGLALWLGYSLQVAFLLGVALSFSSTIIVVKLLSDQRAIDSLYGKIALGILIIQDIVVILSMVAMAGFSSGTEAGTADTLSAGALGAILVKVLAFVVVTGLFIRYAADPLTKTLSRSSELTVIFAIGLTATFAGVAYQLDLSKELGGLLAGVALASTPIREELVSRLAPVRDFLLLFFFVNLGAHLDLGMIGDQVGNALIFSAFVLVGKPVIIMGLTIALGYRARTSFMAGLTLSQISEFSLIFIAMAMTTGLVPQEIAGLITLVGLVTFALSTYGIMYGGNIYFLLEKRFKHIHLPIPRRYEELIQDARVQKDYDVVVIGLGRYGLSIAQQFKNRGFKVLGVDFDPLAIKNAQRLGVSAIYGDASNPDLTEMLPISKTSAIICAFPHYSAGPLTADIRQMLSKGLRQRGYDGMIVATSLAREHEADLIHHGIDLVLSPFYDAAIRAAEQIQLMIDRHRHG
ncbi:MAG: sodium:proton exchanger [Alphaproteobacteria bacterium]|nr:sodium:proton exchanger [Alphaproteobacteria bacterium]